MPPLVLEESELQTALTTVATDFLNRVDLNAIDAAMATLKTRLPDMTRWSPTLIQTMATFNQCCEGTPTNPIMSPIAVVQSCEDSLKLAKKLCAYHDAEGDGNSANIQTHLTALITYASGLDLRYSELNRVSENVLGRPLVHSVTEDLSPLSARLKALQQLSLLALNAQTDSALGAVIGALLKGTVSDVLPEALLDLPLSLDSDGVSALGRTRLDMLHATLFPDRLGVSFSAKWIGVVSHLLGIQVHSSALEVMRASGPSGAVLDGCVAAIPHAALRDAATDFITCLRSHLSASGQVAQQRWLSAERRFGATVKRLNETPLSDVQCSAVVKIVQNWQKKLSDTCSVGVDLQILECGTEIQDYLAEKTPNRDSAREAAAWTQTLVLGTQAHLQASLRGVLPADFASDVHHVTKLMRCIYEKESCDIPDWLLDPDIAGLADRIESNIDRLLAEFRDPAWLFGNVNGHLQSIGKTDLPLREVLARLGPSLTHSPDAANGPELRLQVAVSCMRLGDLSEFRSLCATFTISLPVLHQSLGEHGLLGIAARCGKIAIFEALRTEFSSFSSPIEVPFWNRDVCGYSLLDYAALGGDLGIAASVVSVCQSTAEGRDGMAAHLATSATSTPLPSWVACAAASGRAEMVVYVLDICGDDRIRNAMLSAQDGAGNTAFMRAVMSGSLDTVSAVFTASESVAVASVNKKNNANQTPLMWASVHAHSAEGVAQLLEMGADPTCRIGDGDDLSVLERVMIEGRVEVLHALLSAPQTLSALTVAAIVDAVCYSDHKVCKHVFLAACYMKNADFLKDLDPDGNCLARLLVRYEGEGFLYVLEKMERAHVLDILKIPDTDGVSLAHWISKHEGTTFHHMLEKFSDLLLDILKIPDTDGFLLAPSIAELNKPTFQAMLATFPELLLDILKIPDKNGFSLAHWLTHFDVPAFQCILAKSPALVLDILKIPDQKGFSLAHWLLEKNNAVFRDILDKIEPAQVLNIVKMIDTSDGFLLAHFMIELAIPTFQHILATFPDLLLDILKIHDNQYRSLAEWLIICNPAMLHAIFEKYPEKSLAILTIQNGEGLSFFDAMAKCEGPFLAHIVADLMKADDVSLLIPFLINRNAGNVSFVRDLYRHNRVAYTQIVSKLREADHDKAVRDLNREATESVV